MRLLACLLSAVALLVPSAVRADLVNGSMCKIYSRINGQIAKPFFDMMTKKNNDAAMICSTSSGAVTRYSPATPFYQSPSGVCLFEVLTYAKSGNILLNEETYMSRLRGASCPDQSAPSYLPSTNVSDGLFLVLLDFAFELQSSKTRFEKLTSNIRQDKSRRDEYRELSNALFADPHHNRIRLEAISLAKPLRPRWSGYQLSFGEKPSYPTWIIMVDFTNSGLKVINFDQIH